MIPMRPRQADNTFFIRVYYAAHHDLDDDGAGRWWPYTERNGKRLEDFVARFDSEISPFVAFVQVMKGD